MSDENSASYKKIGLAIAFGAVATAAALFWLGGLEGRYGFVYAETYCDKPVSGLSVGSTVNFRGVKIGQVAKIGFVGDEYNVTGADAYKIYILLSISGTSESLLRRHPIRATVTPSGVTGLSRIEIDMDRPGRRASVPGVGAEEHVHSVQAFDSGQLLRFRDEDHARDSDGELPAGLEQYQRHGEHRHAGVRGRPLIMESNKAEFEKIVGDVSETASSVRALTEELKSNPSLLLRERIASPLPETGR